MRLWTLLVMVCTAGVIALSGYAGWNLRDLPQPGNQAAIVRSVDVFDRNGQLIAQRSPDGEFHIYTPLAELGVYGRDATLAAEDRGFYRHSAVDGPALLRAALTDAAGGRVVEGGSTITQQLVKLTLLGPEQSVTRKTQEAFLAWAMERRYTKDQILEMYLNRVYYGHGAYGLASATKTYFGRDRSPKDLSPAQAAFLAGLLQAPNGYDPKVNWDGAHARELYVLHGMRAMNVLTDAQEQQAEQEDVRAELKYDVTYRASAAPHFVDQIMGEVEHRLGAAVVQQGGLRVYTTLDMGLQALAERSVSAGVADLKHYGVNNGDLLAVHPSTGEVLAWVGSADYASDQIGGQFDVVSHVRAPGSSFKPYVYEAALRDRRITLCTTLDDRPTDFGGGYRPTDFDGRFLGPITARRALVLSRNVPAVQVAKEEGMDRVIALAQQMMSTGSQPPQLDPGLATSIGASPVTMYDQVQGYAVFANQGRKVPLMDITKIETGAGELMYQAQPGAQLGQTDVLTPAQAYLVTDVLRQYQGTWSLGWNPQMAAKSGTTDTGQNNNLHPDAWMMAYNPDIVVGAWAGNTGPDGKGGPTTAYGVNVGQTISARFINGLPRSFRGWYTRPPGLVQGLSGEYFLPGTQTRSCGGGGNGQGQGRKKGDQGGQGD
jgi:membrane peptidoglycan carboxypeptidase